MSTERLFPAATPRGFGRRAATAPLFSFRSAYLAVVGLSVVAVLVVSYWGSSYYLTPLTDRPYHPLHDLFRPSGRAGLTLGIVGAVMMLMIFLYSLRRRSSFLQRFGTKSQWLRIHIFLGFAGPILVTLHTSGKLNGIVSVGFYAMWAVVASGIVGRYLYAKTPRTISGNQMTLQEIEVELEEAMSALRTSQREDKVRRSIERFLAHARRPAVGLLRALGRVVLDDILHPLHAVRVRWSLFADRTLSRSERARVSRLVLRQIQLLNKLAVLDGMRSLFAYWHVFHKPFTIVTFVILFVHVAVVAYFGGIHW